MSSSRKLKKEIFKILQENSFEIIESKLSSFEPENLIHPLFSAICRHEESIRWNGIFSFGSMMKRLVSRNLEDGRVVMRRFLWSLNDESGGIGWGAPEAMAECMVNNVQLLEEYLHMLVSYCQEDGEELFQDGNFLELSSLQRGLLWAICRVSGEFPEKLSKYDLIEEMKFYLGSNDNHVRGLALLCVAGLGYIEECDDQINQLISDKSEFTFFTHRGSHRVFIGETAQLLRGNSSWKIGFHQLDIFNVE